MIIKMNSSQSSFESAPVNGPQHLMNCPSRAEVTTMLPLSRRRRTSISSGLILACVLLSSVPAATALSLTTTKSGASRSLVDQARFIRELKNGSAESEQALQHLAMDTKKSYDNDALSAALFDDDFNSSLEKSVANLKLNGVKFPSKRRAEEFDRFMEEDANVASIVHENTKPGSLVDDVHKNKGADINEGELLLQREAANRRKGLKAGNVNPASSAPFKKVPRKSKVASKPKQSWSSPFTSTKKSKLLTREQEYELAYTIQAGTRVHKIKAEYEASKNQPLSKKEWAQLSDMSVNELRKLISDYRTAKQELVSSNVGLVHAVVKQYSRKANYRGVPMEELVQEGSLGLIRAAELFDPAKGLRFSTYATIWIKGVLSNSNSLEDVISLPSRERVLHNKVRAAWQDMAVEDGKAGSGAGKPPVGSAKAIAQRLGMDPGLVENHLRRMSCVKNVLSLDYQYASATRSGDQANTQDALMNSAQMGDDADLAEQAHFKADLVASMVRNLSVKELTLMRLRYGLEDGTEYTVKECAAKMGINRETARLLQHKCLKKLREASNMESLQEYLLTVA